MWSVNVTASARVGFSCVVYVLLVVMPVVACRWMCVSVAAGLYGNSGLARGRARGWLAVEFADGLLLTL
jgi:hypothetical protein